MGMRDVSILLFAIWVAALFHVVVNLLDVHRLKRPHGEDGRRGPFVSIIVPARNEERAIARTLHALLASDYEPFEVIVVDDCSSDRTREIARSIVDPRLVVIAGEEPPPGWLGKPWAMEQGSRLARGKLLLFVDADVHYEPDALRAAIAHMERKPGVAMLALSPNFEMRGLTENVAMPALTTFGFTLLPAWFSNRSRAATLAVGAGTGNLVRRAAYERVGRHEALRNVVIDDIGLAQLLRRNGEMTEAVRADALVSIRMYHGRSEERRVGKECN